MQENHNPVLDLIGDIGGTNARFALVGANRQPYAEHTLACADFPGLTAAAAHYLQTVDGPRPRRAAVAVATAVTGDRIEFTNSPWSFSTEATRQELGLNQLLILNDFTALALSLP